MTSSVQSSEKVHASGCEVAEFILKGKKAHVIAKILLMPICKNVVKFILGPQATNSIFEVSEVSDMSSDRKVILREKESAEEIFPTYQQVC
jgi:hypothetical protein